MANKQGKMVSPLLPSIRIVSVTDCTYAAKLGEVAPLKLQRYRIRPCLTGSGG